MHKFPSKILTSLLSIVLLVEVSAQSPQSDQKPWSQVRSFGYQLQDLRVEEVIDSPLDLLILDYSEDGSHEERWSKRDVARLKQHPQGNPRLLLAYLSIGEAENYRFYWHGKKRAKRAGWLARRNRDWSGHYRARYWRRSWREIMEVYIDHIVDAGFDGVYLDRVDVYREVEPPEGISAKDNMVEFVKALATRARARGGENFGIFVQNAEELLTEPGYLETITGIGREEIYFGFEGSKKAVPSTQTAQIEQALSAAVNAGKLVLSVDYPKGLKQTISAEKRAKSQGFVHLSTVRKLNDLKGWSYHKKRFR